MSNPDAVPDVLVVGAGGAGCAAAARLSEDPARNVLLLEAGPVPRDGFPGGALDALLVPGAQPGHPYVRGHDALLTTERSYSAPRGRILGGSTTVNGGYFIRARRADFDRWADEAGDARWSYERVLPFLRAMETDHDRPGDPAHGASGPIPVCRSDLSRPAEAAFAAAARELGHPGEPDKNAQGVPGFGPVPTNTLDGVRVNTGLAYLLGALDRPNLVVRGGRTVTTILVERGRATGVVVEDGAGRAVVRAREILVCAGAFATPHLLHVSGIGPASDLARLGIPVVADLPAVGAALSDHPQVAVEWLPRRTVDDPKGTWLGGALHVTASGGSGYGGEYGGGARGAGAADDSGHRPGDTAGDLEILQSLLPLAALTGGTGAAGDAPQAFLVSVQTPRRRGGLRTVSADPAIPPRIEYGYLRTAGDRRRLREAVRAAVDVLGTTAFAEVSAGPADPALEAVGDDRALDAWIRERLGTAQHTCGTVPMGPSGAVDAHGRVHGITGLRVADTSVLPTAPLRGPAATAVLIGELAADSLNRT